METQENKEVESILDNPDFNKIKAYATDIVPFTTAFSTIADQYEVTSHGVFKEATRPKKTITVKTGAYDANGREVERTDSVEVCRIGFPAQNLIVERAVGFLLGYPVNLSPVYYPKETAGQKELFEEVKRVWRKNKLDYKNRAIARILFSEREVAEIWYFWKKKPKDENEKPVLKMKLAYNSNKDLLYPRFDEYGDLEMFSRQYSVERDKVTTEHFDIYTAERIQFWQRTTGAWEKVTDVPNDFEKIPVIYYRQSKAEWENVQSAIDRFEENVSNHADTNDYTGSPIMTVEGEIKGWSSKGERGKVMELEPGAKVGFLVANTAPESVKNERDTVKEVIFSGSQTPDISFYEMRNVGAVSGVTLENMYIDARMKAKTKEEHIGEMFVRRCNVLKAGICKVLVTKLRNEQDNLDFEILFTPFIPKNQQEEVGTLAQAVTGGFLSKKTAAGRLAMADNVDDEMTRLKEEEPEVTPQNASETFE